MNGIQWYKDGNKLVVILEGFEVSDAIKVLSGFSENITQAPDASVEPVETQPAEIPTTFTSGPYQGMSPMELVEGSIEEIDEAGITYLVAESQDTSNVLINSINEALMIFLKKRFNGAVPREYVQKLSAYNVTRLFGYIAKHSSRTFQTDFLESHGIASWNELTESEPENVRLLLEELVSLIVG